MNIFDFRKLTKQSKVFWHFGVFVKQVVILNIRFGFCGSNSVWDHRLKIFFDPPNRKKSFPRNRTFPRIMVLSKIQNSKVGRWRGLVLIKYCYLAKFKIQISTADAAELRILNFAMNLIMVLSKIQISKFDRCRGRFPNFEFCYE